MIELDMVMRAPTSWILSLNLATNAVNTPMIRLQYHTHWETVISQPAKP